MANDNTAQVPGTSAGDNTAGQDTPTKRPPSAWQALALLSAGKTWLPYDTKDVRRILTCELLINFAKVLGSEKQFEGKAPPGFEAAFGNYHVALWRWVWRFTPQDVIDKLNGGAWQSEDTPERQAVIGIIKHRYMLNRAIYLAGVQAGESFNPSHTKYFAALIGPVAALIEDDEVIKAATQRKWNWRKPKVQAGRTAMERQLPYVLLVSWVAGGLWRMATRREQLEALAMAWPELQSYSPEAINMAQKRLGLRWPRRT